MNVIITKWSNDQMGYNFKYIDGVETSQWLIYRPRYAIKCAIDGYLHYLSREPSFLEQILNKEVKIAGPYWTNTDSIFFNLGISYPKIPFSPFVIISINEIVHDFLYREITTEGSQVDIKFMVQTGAKRNWKQNCCICLNEKVGDPRGWGGHHCQIIIFRPCGHSVCDTCFKGFTTCPLCRSNIVSVINHYDPRWPSEIIEELTIQACDRLKYLLIQLDPPYLKP